MCSSEGNPAAVRAASSDADVYLWYVLTEDAKRRGWLVDYQPLLSEEELARHKRFLFEKDRDQFLIARALVRTVLSRYAPVEPADWRFSANPYGRPEIAAPQNPMHLRFNLAHCQGLTLCGVVFDHDIGVDCENTCRPMNHSQIARRFFAADEAAYLESQPQETRADAFFSLWTLKEAYVKACGQGLSLPLQDFSFALSPHREPVISFSARIQDSPHRWKFAQPSIGRPYKVAVAVQRAPERNLRVHLCEA
jgi:4'-phosphopantetheinyl transferase